MWGDVDVFLVYIVKDMMHSLETIVCFALVTFLLYRTFSFTVHTYGVLIK